MEKTGITVVGAGVIGLAVAFELSKSYKDIFVLEKNPSFGQETSSRNSEVIHAGIYYPRGSLKTRTCIEGKTLLYEFCENNHLACKRIGKLIVAIDDSEVEDLKYLFQQGLANGVEDLKFISQEEIKYFEPQVTARAAIYSPSTGIVDSHGVMQSLALQFASHNGQLAYNTELIAVEKKKGGFVATVKDKNGESFKFLTRFLINCAGLYSDKLAQMAGISSREYTLKYCKGDYFRVSPKKSGLINRLVYPLPKNERRGLGIHATLDLSAGLRLGPDEEYIVKIDYRVNESKKEIFYESVKRFLPFIEPDDLSPDTCGIRPKLQGPNEGFRDFIIREEGNNGLSGLINLVGIESPGLTASLSIARIVKGLVDKIS